MRNSMNPEILTLSGLRKRKVRQGKQMTNIELKSLGKSHSKSKTVRVKGGGVLSRVGAGVRAGVRVSLFACVRHRRYHFWIIPLFHCSIIPLFHSGTEAAMRPQWRASKQSNHHKIHNSWFVNRLLKRTPWWFCSHECYVEF
jgi:hypothetical protein